MTVLVAVIGLNPVIGGIKEDASVPHLAFGIAPGQAPPTPMISGPIVALLAAALLLVSAPRFVGRPRA